MPSGYDVANSQALTRMEQHMRSMELSLKAMADAADRATAALELIARALEDPPMEDPPDTSWIETEPVRADYRHGGR